MLSEQKKMWAGVVLCMACSPPWFLLLSHMVANLVCSKAKKFGGEICKMNEVGEEAAGTQRCMMVTELQTIKSVAWLLVTGGGTCNTLLT